MRWKLCYEEVNASSFLLALRGDQGFLVRILPRRGQGPNGVCRLEVRCAFPGASIEW
jgi:hypothetical protein